MKKVTKAFALLLVWLVCKQNLQAQNVNPYCVGGYSSGQCNQPGPSNSPNNFINDFINSVNTTGANINLCNNNSGCNGQANNYINYSASNFMNASPGQTITMNLQSGITFAQGFAVFIDWNQNNVFDLPAERVAFTPVINPAGSWTSVTFTIPANQALGNYRLRIRCAWNTPGNTINPCANLSLGETEDYNITLTAPGVVSSPSFTLTSNGPICAGQTLSLTLTGSIPNPTVTWAGPNGFTSNVQNPVFTNAQSVLNGVYTASVANGSCPIVVTITPKVVDYPVYTVPVTNTVCQNATFPSTLAINGNVQNYSFLWTTNSNQINILPPNVALPFIQTLPIATPSAIIVYSVVVTPTLLNCPVTTTLSVQINNPPVPMLTVPGPLCNNSAPTTVTANPPGGTWYGNQIVSPAGIVTPNAANVFGVLPVSYSLAYGICTASNQANISINQFRSAAFVNAIPNLCVLNNPFNLMSVVQNNNGSWVGTGVNSNTSFFNPANLPTNTYILSYFNPSFPNGNICPSTGTISVQVYNPVTPTISPIAPLCSKAPAVALTANPGGGNWSGNAGVNASGFLIPANAANTAGINTVVYAAGQGTCVATATATFHVSRFNTAALTSNGLNLCSNSNPVNLMTITQNTNGTWWGNNLSGPANTIFSPLGLLSGTYQVTYTTASTPPMANGVCTDTTRIPISVLNPVVPSIVQAGPFCTADPPIQLSVSPATGSFIPTPYLTAGGLFTPSLTVPGNNSVQYIIGSSTCSAVDTKQINMEAFVPATIAAGLPDQCVTSPIISLSPLELNHGVWEGPGVAGTSFNPGLSGTGSIILKHRTVSSPSGFCPDEQTIAVNVYSLATPVITQEGPFCNSHAPVSLQAIPVGGIFECTSNKYAISPGGVFNPAYTIIGDNVVNYSVTAGPCIAFAKTIITIEEFITAGFSQYLNPLCRNNDPVDLNTYVQKPGGTWSGPGMLGSIFSPANANVGNNTVTYHTQSTTTDLCPDNNTMRIEVYNVPDLKVTANINKGCAPLEVSFNTPSTNTGEGTWIFGDGTEGNGLSASHIYTAQGTYSVTFNYWTANTRCPAQAILPNMITSYEAPQPAFTYSPHKEITIADPLVQLINVTPGLSNNTYQWQVADLYSTTEVNPETRFFEAGEYKITLTATNIQGCKNDVSEVVVVKPDFRVFIPNSFTPNFDGINDEFFPVFSPFGLDHNSYEMEIFDRWGSSLFYTTSITKGWNGTVQGKGIDPMKEGTYVYKLKFKDLEGKTYQKTGNVTLLN